MAGINPGRLRAMCLMSMMGVVLVVSKEVLAFLPNFELVSFLTIMFTLAFGRLALGAVGVFLALEGLLYGFGQWWIMYLYIWPLLWLLTWLFRNMQGAVKWALFSGLYGLCFGTLCSFVYLPVGGLKMMAAYIASGLPFDLIHCVGNTLLMLVLYSLRGLLQRLRNSLYSLK